MGILLPYPPQHLPTVSNLRICMNIKKPTTPTTTPTTKSSSVLPCLPPCGVSTIRLPSLPLPLPHPPPQSHKRKGPKTVQLPTKRRTTTVLPPIRVADGIQCPFGDGLLYSSPEDLWEFHIERMHMPPPVKGSTSHTCLFCFDEFKRRAHLIRHVKTLHCGILSVKCPFPGCSRVFAEQHHLKPHLLSHTKQSPYKCPSCGTGFTDVSNLKKHHQNQHGSPLVKIFTTENENTYPSSFSSSTPPSAPEGWGLSSISLPSLPSVTPIHKPKGKAKPAQEVPPPPSPLHRTNFSSQLEEPPNHEQLYQQSLLLQPGTLEQKNPVPEEGCDKVKRKRAKMNKMAEEVRVKAQARNLEIKEQEAQAKEELNKRSQLKEQIGPLIRNKYASFSTLELCRYLNPNLIIPSLQDTNSVKKVILMTRALYHPDRSRHLSSLTTQLEHEEIWHVLSEAYDKLSS